METSKSGSHDELLFLGTWARKLHKNRNASALMYGN